MASWNKLLCGERYVPGGGGSAGDDPNFFSNLELDTNHIVFSSAYRRMQKKAQVYIATDNDFLRNRLTHTLEVVSIGRMLGGLVVKNLDKDGEHYDVNFATAKRDKGISKREIVESISAACHAHDIGNPPFGHIGEYAIRSWFAQQNKKHQAGTLKSTHPHLDKIFGGDSRAAADLLRYDGNPQGFRLLTRLQGWKEDGGLRLTYDTLATFFKYVNGSDEDVNEKKRKFGYFSSEEKYFKDIFNKLGLINPFGKAIRHPFSYVMEAADDIAYCCSDIEDGVKARLVPVDEAIAVLKEISISRIEKLGMKPRFNWLVANKSKTDVLKYLRSTASHALIYACYQAFFLDGQIGGKKNYEIMLEGDFSGSLVQSSELWEQYELASSISWKYIYGSKSKIVREQGCHQIIRFFMNIFSDAIEEWHNSNGNIDNLTDRSRNALMVMHRIYDNTELSSKTTKDRNVKILRRANPVSHYRVMIDFVSGMTDNYATNMARVIRGTSLMDIK